MVLDYSRVVSYNQIMKRQHVCDTESPQRPCCWMARRAELEAMKARQSDPAYIAEQAEYDARKSADHADSFIGRGLD